MDYFKLEIYIPESHFPALRKALQAADAGHIGSYDSCLSYARVQSTWRPLPGTKPYLGAVGQISEAEELKVETTVPKAKLADTLQAIKSVHPYEEPGINVIQLCAVGL